MSAPPPDPVANTQASTDPPAVKPEAQPEPAPEPKIENIDAPTPTSALAGSPAAAASPSPTVKSGLSKTAKICIENILKTLQFFVDENGVEIGGPFSRLVPKRSFPEYYEIIKEPIAYSTIRAKLTKKEYSDFKQVTRDFALITHNALIFNKPTSAIAISAVRLGKAAKEELDKLAEEGIISKEDTEFPYLGEIPVHDETGDPPEEEEEEEEPEEEIDEDEDDEEDDVTDDDRPKRKGKRGKRRSSTTIASRKPNVVEKEEEDPDSLKKRGRPPKVQTPMEARIDNLLKNLRKFKDDNGVLKIYDFERLPDKATLPDYYVEVKNPIALDVIKRKAKRKKYQSVDQVLADLNLMFDNAKSYNLDSSQVYKDAVFLQQEAAVLALEEKQKPDSDFVDEDGRLPVSEILHNGEVYKVGDWIHLENGNDITKPIVAQIYRTWSDADGQKWINACWYYRPEQTVHRYEKHFLENEVVKTGQYRDHKVEEITDRCFVMFVTRYFKGRPRGIDAEKEVYVCEARYNEEKFKLNKIKTWASCVPDEVRDKDYEMDLFDAPRKMKKVPSPIKHLLREDAKEDDPLPKPTWGVSNAPPIVGAVHKRPREYNESPPPEPTPSPPPPTPQPIRRAPVYDNSGDVRMSGVRQSSSSIPPPSPHQASMQAYPQGYAPRPSQSPAPVLHHQTSYGSQGSSHQTHIAQAPAYQSQQSYGQYSTPSTPAAPSPMVNYSYQNVPAPRPVMQQSSSHGSHSAAYNPPKPVEVYTLPDQANNAIPIDIRSQFHRDDYGRVIFYTAPPLAIDNSHAGPELNHSLRYLADKARAASAEADSNKRTAASEDLENAASGRLKRIKSNGQGNNEWIQTRKAELLEKWTESMDKGTDELYRKMHGEGWEAVREEDRKALIVKQQQAAEKQRELEEWKRGVKARKEIPITGFKWI